MSQPRTEPTEVREPTSTTPRETEAATPEPLLEQELLVEDVSIDGMCGVY